MDRITREKNHLQNSLIEKLDFNQQISDEEIKDRIEEAIVERGHEVFFDVSEKQVLKRQLFNALRRLDVISQYLEDDSISEIMVNGKDQIFVEQNGAIHKVKESFASEERLRNVIQQIVSGCNRIVNESSPIVDARLEDGSRVNVVLPPIALDGSILTIRKFPKEFFTMDKLLQLNSITPQAAAFLENLVKARYNIFISGGTGSGKTTFLNVLSNYIPGDERVITIEDSAELQIHNVENLVRLETRNANVEGENEIGIAQLIRSALRMRPDRIIVGEVRGAEASDMLHAQNTGHDGSICTGHGNSAKEMMLRLETMILMGCDMPVSAIRQQIAAAIDIVVHLGRLRDNSRRVLEICEITGVKDGEIQMHTLYKFHEVKEVLGKVIGELRKEDELMYTEKLRQRGIEVERIGA